MFCMSAHTETISFGWRISDSNLTKWNSSQIINGRNNQIFKLWTCSKYLRHSHYWYPINIIQEQLMPQMRISTFSIDSFPRRPNSLQVTFQPTTNFLCHEPPPNNLIEFFSFKFCTKLLTGPQKLYIECIMFEKVMESQSERLVLLTSKCWLRLRSVFFQRNNCFKIHELKFPSEIWSFLGSINLRIIFWVACNNSRTKNNCTKIQ